MVLLSDLVPDYLGQLLRVEHRQRQPHPPAFFDWPRFLVGSRKAQEDSTEAALVAVRKWRTCAVGYLNPRAGDLLHAAWLHWKHHADLGEPFIVPDGLRDLAKLGQDFEEEASSLCFALDGDNPECENGLAYSDAERFEGLQDRHCALYLKRCLALWKALRVESARVRCAAAHLPAQASPPSVAQPCQNCGASYGVSDHGDGFKCDDGLCLTD